MRMEENKKALPFSRKGLCQSILIVIKKVLLSLSQQIIDESGLKVMSAIALKEAAEKVKEALS